MPYGFNSDRSKANIIDSTNFFNLEMDGNYDGNLSSNSTGWFDILFDFTEDENYNNYNYLPMGIIGYSAIDTDNSTEEYVKVLHVIYVGVAGGKARFRVTVENKGSSASLRPGMSLQVQFLKVLKN